jgi:uncharacterized protein YkwD
LHPNRNGRAALAAPFDSLRGQLSSHRGITRVSLTAISFALIIAFSAETPATQAGPESVPMRPDSLLPQNVGIGVPTDEPVTIAFDAAMNPGTVESALQVLPDQRVELAWSENLDSVTISPERLWRTDESYVVVVGGSAARTDGQLLAGARRYAFTTRTAPIVSDFQVRLAAIDQTPSVPDEALDPRAEAMLHGDEPVQEPGTTLPTNTAKSVSASSAITVSFSDEMDRTDVEERFAISPAVPGDLAWDGGNLVFTPAERLTPGARYTINVIGAHDREGNALGGKGNFSFIVQPGAQVTKTAPEPDALDVEPASAEIWFSQPMDVDATNAAFVMTDTNLSAPVAGNVNWNETHTQLVYVPDAPFTPGRTFQITFNGGARDVDGNVIDTTLTFTTKAAPAPVVATPTVARGVATTRSAPVIPPAGPATSLAGHALNQVNAARAAYGFAPLVLDAGISAAASSHALDQATNGYFSHYGQNGSTRESRLHAAGVSFSYSAENQCYHMGMSEQATLDWCHAQFMAEPYPGHWNHIGNILDPRATRMGVGIGTAGGRTVITWNFTN